MIRVLCGETGAGKSKQIIDMANASIQDAKGSIVFVADGVQYMYDLKRDIRYVDAVDYHIEGPKMFFGFISGIAAQDFDLEILYIDGFLKIVKHPLETLEELFASLDAFAQRRNIDIVLCISNDADATPAFLRKYIG